MKILIIVIAAFMVRAFGGVCIDWLVRKLVLPGRFTGKETEKKRKDTLIEIFTTSLSILVWIISALMVLATISAIRLS